MSKIINIALDGPSGSGKTTVAKEISKRLNIAYLDTGAMYRGVAYYMLSKGIDVADVEKVKENLNNFTLEVIREDDEQKILIDKKDVSGLIRTQEISFAASTVSKIPEVRLKLVEMQRAIAKSASCVLDGRDIGSYVLPDAEYKFYLTADVDERAKRRYLEQRAKNMEVTLERVKTEMIARDEQDSKRAFAPLVVPTGAFVIDTTNMTLEEVLDLILSRINK